MRAFFHELKRRRVYRVALAYGIFASAMIQVGGTILPIFHAPEWGQQVFVVLIAIGFPFALVLGWLYDITAEGIQRTPNAKGLRVYSGRQLWLVAVAGTSIAALALAGYWFWHPWRNATKETSDVSSNGIPAKSIAVLPFQNLSPDNAGTFFADGVQDQILTNLAKVSDLKVISHTSVQQYRNQPGRNVREIGRQLGVAYILEGTVQRAPGRVRVNAKLIDALTDSQIWAESYDRDVADLFVIQSDLAQAIVNQLQAKLSPQQKAEIEETPTRDLAAFDLYLQAKEIVDAYTQLQDPGSSLLKAVRLLDEASARDPNFLLAYTFILERRFPEAKLASDRAIAAGMREPIDLIRRASLDYGETGDPTTLRAALAAAPDTDVGGGETSWRILMALIDRDYNEARRVLAASPREDFQDVDFTFYFPRAWYEAQIARAEGDKAKAASAFTAVRTILESRLKNKPNDPRTLAVLAQVDANLGNKALALKEAQQAVDLRPVSKDAYDGPLILQGLAQVYTWTGDYDRALDQLQTLLGMPGYISYGYLKTDPAWQPLRAHPRFQQLLASMVSKRWRPWGLNRGSAYPEPTARQVTR